MSGLDRDLQLFTVTAAKKVTHLTMEW